MKRALIVTHLEDRHTGLTRECLERAGCSVSGWSLLDGPPAPAIGDLAGIVSLGGRESATAAGEHPFLAAEVALMQAALQAEVPILGMCLGAQLLAVAAGGRVSRLPRMYVGWPPLSLLEAAHADPLFHGLPPGLPVLKWHEDTIVGPADSVSLGVTSPVPGQTLFRIGACAWGSQMHLEATPPMLLDGWLAQADGIAEIESAGYEIAAFRTESRRRLADQMAASQPVFTRFGELMLARQGRRVRLRQPALTDRPAMGGRRGPAGARRADTPRRPE